MERAFYKIAMRPGKPLMAGRLGEAALLGLPGNPVSALVCGHLFLVPMLRAFLGLKAGERRRRKARLGADLAPNGPREHYMRAEVFPTGEVPEIVPFDRAGQLAPVDPEPGQRPSGAARRQTPRARPGTWSITSPSARSRPDAA
jgi:molybdopterin biosynthesis enzyme